MNSDICPTKKQTYRTPNMSSEQITSIEIELESILKAKGADVVKFVDISNLPKRQTKGYVSAILFGIALSPQFIKKVAKTPNYVQILIQYNQIQDDEFHNLELYTDRLADELADFLISKGYPAYSQSEGNINSTGYYDKENKSTPLPHKTLALLASLGWIGKNNLLITPEYGCALGMCSVLTNAPLPAVSFTPARPECGDCTICKETCSPNAIKGNSWSISTPRDELVDVQKCTTCLECLVCCPWTRAYADSYDSRVPKSR